MFIFFLGITNQRHIHISRGGVRNLIPGDQEKNYIFIKKKKILHAKNIKEINILLYILNIFYK